jgi:glucokinase
MNDSDRPTEELSPRTAIAFDIGGTKIAAGVVSDNGRILEHVLVATPATDDENATLDVLRSTTDQLLGRHPTVEAIGVGAAGMVEWPSGYIRWAPNNTYRTLPLRNVLTQHTGLPVVVENDANAAALAEARFGSAVGYSHSITLTVGTGIGGGIVLDNSLYRGPVGLGGEVGHMIVDARYGPQCGCGAVGCLEAMASGSALTRLGREAAKADPQGLLANLAGGAEKVTGEVIFAAAKQNDTTALGLFQEVSYWLGTGIASLVNILDPEVVILAGGLGTSAAHLILEPTRSAFETFVFGRSYRTLPRLVVASLGHDAGLIGAATVALDEAGSSNRVPDLRG